jgi:hypothetical protein
MIERPILFSSAMVRAILDGTKGQTRRVLRLPPTEVPWRFAGWRRPVGDLPAVADFERGEGLFGLMVDCPYGRVGDRLWVRETWAVDKRYDAVPPRDLPGQDGGTGRRIKIHYLADGPKPAWAGKTRVSIHMPRWASRIELEVARLRAELLHDITEDDAKAEGVDLSAWGAASYRECFSILWDTINGPRGAGWAERPWVWVVDFWRRVAS